MPRIKWSWEPSPGEAEYDLTPFKVVEGTVMPEWAMNALARREIVPVPKPKVGQPDWAGRGVRVVKTGEFFPLGSVVMKGDLFGPSV